MIWSSVTPLLDTYYRCFLHFCVGSRTCTHLDALCFRTYCPLPLPIVFGLTINHIDKHITTSVYGMVFCVDVHSRVCSLCSTVLRCLRCVVCGVVVFLRKVTTHRPGTPTTVSMITQTKVAAIYKIGCGLPKVSPQYSRSDMQGYLWKFVDIRGSSVDIHKGFVLACS